MSEDLDEVLLVFVDIHVGAWTLRRCSEIRVVGSEEDDLELLVFGAIFWIVVSHHESDFGYTRIWENVRQDFECLVCVVATRLKVNYIIP